VNIEADQPDVSKTTSSTAGMTTRVVKGSMWTLAGQVLPMGVSLFTTPFVIRFLGAEQYGLLVLVGLIPAYFGFADLGMGIASTRFASEAFGQGDATKEAEVVWTAAIIAVLSSAVVALPIFLFSGTISSALNIPEHLRDVANASFKIVSVSFVIGILSSVFNTPQLSRLRMDLNTAINTIPKVLFTIAAPIVLYLGFGIVGAVTAVLIGAVAALCGHIYVSSRLQPKLIHATWSFALARPLLKFAGGWLFVSIAALILTNIEKLVLTRMVSVRSLAYYSVAFMCALLATTFSSAMTQSLIPAFSQLLGPGRKAEFDRLFSRTVRLSLVWLLPTVMLMVVAAKPFLTLWAGEDFGRESTPPFYILIVGLFFNVLAFIPQSTIIARGHTVPLAKLYWIELPLYLVGVVLMIHFFGIAGAAAAWSIRVTIDMLVIVWMAMRFSEIKLSFLSRAGHLAFASAFLVLPILIALYYDNYSLFLVPAVLISSLAYLLIVWSRFLEPGERDHVRTLLRTLRYRFAGTSA
jgi:O-antigen/teichoic acid export membrane protein